MSNFVFNENLGFLINRTGFLMRDELVKRFAAQGIAITAEEWALLGATHQNKTITVTSLSQATFKDRTTVTRLLDKLVIKLLISRKPAARDKRVIEVTLTPKGQKTTVKAMKVVSKFVREIESHLPESERRATAKALAKICAALDEGFVKA